jgi:hypothetical protein
MEVFVRQDFVAEDRLTGFLVNTLALPIDGERVEKLVGFIVRGLVFHHWGVVLGIDCFVDVFGLTKHGESFFSRFGKMNAGDRVRGNIGDCALVYEGAQGTDNPLISIWEISLFGSMKMVGDNAKESTTKFGVMAGTQSIKDRAEEKFTSGKFIHLP